MRASFVATAVVVSGLFLFALLAPGPAQACCTSRSCPFCVSKSSDCVCGERTAVCNIFACNCNAKCGLYNYIYPNCNYFLCSDAEAANDARKRFDEVDANQDDKISNEEAWAWASKLESSGVEKVRQEDLPANLEAAAPRDVFDYELGRIDTNQDGFIQPGEFDSSLGAAAKSGS